LRFRGTSINFNYSISKSALELESGHGVWLWQIWHDLWEGHSLAKGFIPSKQMGFGSGLVSYFYPSPIWPPIQPTPGRPMRLAFCDGIGPQTGRGHIAQWLESPWTSGAHWGFGQGWATSHTADTQWVPEQLPKRDSQIVWTTGVDVWMPMLRCLRCTANCFNWMFPHESFHLKGWFQMWGQNGNVYSK
jgi:hypothetical protein